MKTSLVILICHLFTTTVCNLNPDSVKPSSGSTLDHTEKDNDGQRVLRSIDSILDTLVSLESPTAQSEVQSQSQSANTNNRPLNVLYTGGPRHSGPRQSRLFTDNKTSKGSSTSVSSPYKSQAPKTENPNEEGRRRFDDNFPIMIPFPYPPPFGAFPGFEHNRDSNSKQSSFPQADSSSYGSAVGNRISGKDSEDDFYGQEYPESKSILSKQNQNLPRHHKDHEILRATGYPSSKVFYPSHGIPSPKEINIPMFSQGKARGYHPGTSPRYAHGQQAKGISYGGFEELRDIEKALGLRREPHGNQEDHPKGQLSFKSYGDGPSLFSHGEHPTRYGEGQSNTNAYRDQYYPAHRYGEGQSDRGELSGGSIYGEGQSVHRDHSGHRYGEGRSNDADYPSSRFLSSEHRGLNEDDGHINNYPSLFAAYNTERGNGYGEGQRGATGQGLIGEYGEGQLRNPVHANFGTDLSGYEGYGVGPSSFHSSTGSSGYPGTNSIWRGFGQNSENHYGNDEKAQLTPTINAAALQALSGISALNRDPSHSYNSRGIGGSGVGSSYNNQYKDLSNSYAGLFK